MAERDRAGHQQRNRFYRVYFSEFHFALNKKKLFLAVYLEDVLLPEELELGISSIQAIMKWKMPEDDYLRKMRKALPELCLGKLPDSLAAEEKKNAIPGNAPSIAASLKRKAETPRDQGKNEGAVPLQKRASEISERRRFIPWVVLGAFVMCIAGLAYQTWDKKAEPASTETVKKSSESSTDMVLITAGYFNMGSSEGVGDADEHPRHRVYVDAFYIDKTEVTFDQYDKYCEANDHSKPSDDGWGRGKRPVININWKDADAYCKWAGKRLPTEAEWEKAVRGGTDTEWYWGDSDNQIGDYAWYKENSGAMTHPVGQKKSNPFGLFDMAGNVWEWCADWYGADYYKSSPERNPKGPEDGTDRVLRGGSWVNFTDCTRSAGRLGFSPVTRYGSIGCRCARTP
jgi:formylglycine-generating enzyme required for sulfatase activity